jgi:hypothetical protein
MKLTIHPVRTETGRSIHLSVSLLVLDNIWKYYPEISGVTQGEHRNVQNCGRQSSLQPSGSKAIQIEQDEKLAS